MPETTSGESFLQITLPPGTPEHTEAAVRRLVDVTATLARRCAQLQEALDSRVVIEQAKGVLAERFHLEPDHAFEVLRRSARSNRIPLRDLASRVVSSQRTPREVAAHLDGAPRGLAPNADSR
jgi:ANTAR domain-containing protein